MSDTINVIEKYFTTYAAAVAQSRALISVEDGLKPSLRMLLYANYDDGYIQGKKKVKYQRLVSSGFRYYIHGDQACYGMIIRAAKPFAMRYPLYFCQGSYGTQMSPKSHAAMRYVEGGISKLATQLFTNIKKDTIEEWQDNFDNTDQYPRLLPSIGFWNLVNGTQGIGSGISASIPQFNLKEMNEALAHMVLGESYKIPLPDFATGGILLNSDEVKESLMNGTGKGCKIRARIDYDEKRRTFKVIELPYAVYTETICDELAELMQDPTSGIDSFNDATGKKPDIEIYLTKTANPQEVLQTLYKKTSLQSTFGINLTMLENCRFPRVYTLPEAMAAYLTHQYNVYERAYKYDLEVKLAKIHILEGYKIILEDIENVIQIIKNSRDKKEAAINLQNKYNLSSIQTDAILKMPLSKITSLEVEKIINEINELQKEIEEIKEILNNPRKIKEEIATALRTTGITYGDERRTKLLNITEEMAEKIMYFTPKGKIYIGQPKNEPVIKTLTCGTPYLVVTKNGLVFRGTEVPKRAKQIFKLTEDDTIIAVYPDDEEKFLVFLDDEKHFRCKEVSSLNKNKTKLSLTNLIFAAVTSKKATKANYKQLILEENKN